MIETDRQTGSYTHKDKQIERKTDRETNLYTFFNYLQQKVFSSFHPGGQNGSRIWRKKNIWGYNLGWPCQIRKIITALLISLFCLTPIET